MSDQLITCLQTIAKEFPHNVFVHNHDYVHVGWYVPETDRMFIRGWTVQTLKAVTVDISQQMGTAENCDFSSLVRTWLMAPSNQGDVQCDFPCYPEEILGQGNPSIESRPSYWCLWCRGTSSCKHKL